jgi:hypothetical protein
VDIPAAGVRLVGAEDGGQGRDFGEAGEGGRRLEVRHEALDRAQPAPEIELHGAQLEELDVEAVLEFSRYLVLNASRMWSEATLPQRQRLCQFLFPDGLTYADGEVRTAEPAHFSTTYSHPRRVLNVGIPNGIRTRVAALKGRSPRPLDDGDAAGTVLDSLAARHG